jgi:hypothetical protein
MDIRNKEPMFITQDGKEYVVRQGTVGVMTPQEPLP